MASSTVDRRPARGREGEDAALRVYLRHGYRLVARNWRCPLGELDLVLERDGVLVACEVKTRTGAAFGGGYEAVTWSKRRKLRHLAEAFLAANPGRHDGVRFDVASVWLGPNRADVEVFEDAF
ncbi:MAG TPA: YraN family protein [Actinomycetota bacterium]